MQFPEIPSALPASNDKKPTWRWLHEFLEEKGVTLDDNFKRPVPEPRKPNVTRLYFTKHKNRRMRVSEFEGKFVAWVRISEGGFVICGDCGEETDYKVSDPNVGKYDFVEGKGQLCFKCGRAYDGDGAC